MKNRRLSQNGKPDVVHAIPGTYYDNRTNIDRSAHSDGARRYSCVAAQPELGFWPERWLGFGSVDFGYPAITGPDLNGATQAAK